MTPEDEIAKQDVIIDSSCTLEEAIIHCQTSTPPIEIVQRQRLIPVEYYSFDGKLHKGQYVIDQDLAEDVKEAFKVIRETHFPISLVDPTSTSTETSAGFFYRVNTSNPNELSKHAYGRAIDINPMTNPYIRGDFRKPEGAKYNPSLSGTLTGDSPIVKFFKERGWEWGGDWTDRVDYMHFEKP